MPGLATCRVAVTRPVSLRGLSEFEDGAVAGCEVVSGGGVLDVLRLVLELLLFERAVGQVVPFEAVSEGAVRVGDVVNRAVLFDVAGYSFPFDPSARVVRHGPEAVGEVAGLVSSGFVATGAGVGAEREIGRAHV